MIYDIKTILLDVAVVSATAAAVIKFVLIEYEGVRRELDRVSKVTRSKALADTTPNKAGILEAQAVERDADI